MKICAIVLCCHMQTAGYGKHASSGTMETGKYMPLSVIMIDYKMVNTNVFLNIMQLICARIYENKSPVFLICTYIYMYTHIHTHTQTGSYKIIHTKNVPKT